MSLRTRARRGVVALVAALVAVAGVAVGSTAFATSPSPSVNVTQVCRDGVAVVQATTTAVMVDDYVLVKVDGQFTERGEGTLADVNAWVATLAPVPGTTIQYGVNAYDDRTPEALLWSSEHVVDACAPAEPTPTPTPTTDPTPTPTPEPTPTSEPTPTPTVTPTPTTPVVTPATPVTPAPAVVAPAPVKAPAAAVVVTPKTPATAPKAVVTD